MIRIAKFSPTPLRNLRYHCGVPRRPEMLASEIRKLIAPVLRECPPECGIVTITEVDVSSDSSIITVRVSALKHHPMALTFMQERKGELRHALKALHMHRLPELRFALDLRSEKGSRIEKILADQAEEHNS